MINYILICVIILFLILIFFNNKKNNKEFNTIIGNKSNISKSKTIEHLDDISSNSSYNEYNQEERDRISKFNDRFFNFHNRINHNSLTTSPVDRINLLRTDINTNQNLLNKNIDEIYDTLVDNGY